MFQNSIIFISLFSIISSCSWNQNEIKKLSKLENEIKFAPQDDEEKKLLEKFSVENEEPPLNVESKKEIKALKTIKPKVPAKKITRVEKVDPSQAADYPKDLLVLKETSQVIWSKFKEVFSTGEKSYLDIDYMGMTVGKILIGVHAPKVMNNKQVHHFYAKFKSAPFYSALYELDDQVETFVMKDSFTPIRFNLIQRESKQDIDEFQIFDVDNLYTKAFSHLRRKDKERKKDWKGYIPERFVDAFSVVFFLRGLPLESGDKYTIPIVNKGSTILLNCEVIGVESIEVLSKTVKAIKVKAFSHYSGKTLKSGDMTFWFSHEKNHEVLKVKAKISLGSVYAEKAEAP